MKENQKFPEYFPRSYLGDGVYAVYDGYGINLMISNPDNPTDIIYVEPDVLDALNGFYKRCTERSE